MSYTFSQFWHNFSRFFLILLILSCTLLVPSNNVTQGANGQPENNPNPNLKYFGYMHAAGMPFNSSNPDNFIGTDLVQLANSNVVHFRVRCCTSDDLSKDRGWLQSAKQANTKVILDIEPVFVNITQGRGITYAYSTSLAQSNWISLSTQTLNGYEDTIYAFYLDEAWQSGHYTSTTISNWKNIIQQTAAFTNTRWMDTEPTVVYPSVAPTNTRPVLPPDYFNLFTDVAIENYFYGRPDLYPGGFTNFAQKFNELKTTLAPTQTLWIIPEAYVLKNQGDTSGPQTVSGLTTALNQYYSFAISQTRVTGLLSFVYDWDAATSVGPDRYSAHQIFNATTPITTYNQAGTISATSSVNDSQYYKLRNLDIGRGIAGYKFPTGSFTVTSTNGTYDPYIHEYIYPTGSTITFTIQQQPNTGLISKTQLWLTDYYDSSTAPFGGQGSPYCLNASGRFCLIDQSFSNTSTHTFVWHVPPNSQSGGYFNSGQYDVHIDIYNIYSSTSSAGLRCTGNAYSTIIGNGSWLHCSPSGNDWIEFITR